MFENTFTLEKLNDNERNDVYKQGRMNPFPNTPIVDKLVLGTSKGCIFWFDKSHSTNTKLTIKLDGRPKKFFSPVRKLHSVLPCFPKYQNIAFR